MSNAPAPHPSQPLPTDHVPEAVVQQVMRELRFDYLQARNHVRCRMLLQTKPPAPRHYD